MLVRARKSPRGAAQVDWHCIHLNRQGRATAQQIYHDSVYDTKRKMPRKLSFGNNISNKFVSFSCLDACALCVQEPLLADYWDARDAGNFSEALVSLKLVQADMEEGLGTGTAAGLSTYADLATFAK